MCLYVFADCRTVIVEHCLVLMPKLRALARVLQVRFPYSLVCDGIHNALVNAAFGWSQPGMLHVLGDVVCAPPYLCWHDQCPCLVLAGTALHARV